MSSKNIREVSVFVDESGSFEPDEESSDFVPAVHPESYRLFQAADLFCTVELAAAKARNGELSVSEKRFFGESREFLRNILRPLRNKMVQ